MTPDHRSVNRISPTTITVVKNWNVYRVSRSGRNVSKA